MKPFDTERFSFGRHESFPLRFGWLSKGYRLWCDSETAFDEDDATVALGVGKNMVHAIRYWMIAAQVAVLKEHELVPTPIGMSIFCSTGWDPYLEDDTTLW